MPRDRDDAAEVRLFYGEGAGGDWLVGFCRLLVMMAFGELSWVGGLDGDGDGASRDWVRGVIRRIRHGATSLRTSRHAKLLNKRQAGRCDSVARCPQIRSLTSHVSVQQSSQAYVRTFSNCYFGNADNAKVGPARFCHVS